MWKRHAKLKLVVILLAVLSLAVWWRMFREVTVEYDDPVDRFYYSTIGVESAEGFPLDIWLVLPEVFSDFLPSRNPTSGYADFGFLYKDDRVVPVGFSTTYKGFDRIGLNCAVCHAGSYRLDFSSSPTIVPAAPAIRADLQAYIRFLFRCARDDRFNTETLLDAIRKRRSLRIDESALLKVLIPVVRNALQDQEQTFRWADANPRWGPGRIDPFNPIKFGMLKRPLDRTIGNSDMMPIWRLASRGGNGARLHWDGLNGSVYEVLYSSALGDGATPRTLDPAGLQAMEEWLSSIEPRKYPAAIDSGLAKRGREIFNRHCGDCHGANGTRTGSVIPYVLNVEDEDSNHIATDPERIFMWDSGSAEAYNRYGVGYTWKFNDFKNIDGYVAVPLDGLWLRGPYLHNGSVPTLWHLLHPDQRPTVFYRGCDVLDTENVGFVWERSQENGLPYFLFDTRLPGNANTGHRYGHELSEQEKAALIEYLKTL